MKYSIEIGKIVEGALKRDQQKVINYTKMLAEKLEKSGDTRTANKFNNMLSHYCETTLSPMGLERYDKSIPVDNESRMLLADIVYPSDNTENVILSEKNKNEIEQFILNYKNADALHYYGIDLSNTLLLYGPPGCGKTKCAYLIAKELNLPLVIARLDSLISSYLGTTAKNIRTLFEFTQKFPCVLFLDEFDAIAKARDDNNELGELKRVVNSLLQNVDTMSNDSLLIAASNHEALLDAAVWRRFDYKLEVNYPDESSIEKMIDLFLGHNYQVTQKEKKELVSIMDGMSGADIELIINKSIRNSVVHSLKFSVNDIYNEFFNHKNIIPQGCTDNKEILEIKAKYLREQNSKVFSLQTIADILGSSKTTISKIIKEDNLDG